MFEVEYYSTLRSNNPRDQEGLLALDLSHVGPILPTIAQWDLNRGIWRPLHYVKVTCDFKDAVQDSPRMVLGIPVKTKKNPLSNQYTARGTAFRL